MTQNCDTCVHESKPYDSEPCSTCVTNINPVSWQPKTEKARDLQIGGDHYKGMGVEPWDVIDTWPIEQQIGFFRGNALKYVMRMGTKDENAQEIRKASHYLQKLAEVLDAGKTDRI